MFKERPSTSDKLPERSAMKKGKKKLGTLDLSEESPQETGLQDNRTTEVPPLGEISEGEMPTALRLGDELVESSPTSPRDAGGFSRPTIKKLPQTVQNNYIAKPLRSGAYEVPQKCGSAPSVRGVSGATAAGFPEMEGRIRALEKEHAQMQEEIDLLKATLHQMEHPSRCCVIS